MSYGWRLRLRSRFPFPWQSHWLSLRYNNVAEWDLRTEAGSCLAANLNPIALLKAVKDAIGRATDLYYQVYSACGPSGVDEGPF